MAQNESSFWDSIVDACPNFVGVTVATVGKTIADFTGGVLETLTGHGSEVADMVDKKAEETARFFDSLGDDLVTRFPNKGGAVAATAITSIPKLVLQFGQGLADSARFGTGLAEGTWTGVGKDILRALPIVSPAITSLAGLRAVRLANAYIDPARELGACMPVGLAKAFRQAGQGRVFGKLSEMIGGILESPLGRESLDAGRSFREMVSDLRRIGAEFNYSATDGTLESVKSVLRARPDGIVSFAAQWDAWNAEKKTFESVGHALYAFLDEFGRLRIADRTTMVAKSLSEFDSLYPGIAKATLQTASMYIPKAKYLLNAGSTVGGIGLALNVVTAKASQLSAARSRGTKVTSAKGGR